MKPQQILALEKELGFELTETKNPDDIFDWETSECYFLDDKQEVLGLNLNYCELTDVSFLQGLSNLDFLCLADNQITDISFLQGLSNLQHLDLWGNQITDISILQYLSNLEKLLLGCNKIQDISFLQGLNNLKYLNLSENQITDISFLEGLSNLEYLNISDNDIQDFGYLKSLQNLNEFYANQGVVDWHFSFQTNGENTRIVLRFESKIVCGYWANYRFFEECETATLQDFRKSVEQKYGQEADAYCPQLWTFLKY